MNNTQMSRWGVLFLLFAVIAICLELLTGKRVEATWFFIIMSTIFNVGSSDIDSDNSEVVESEVIDKEVLSKVINILEGEPYEKWESLLMTSSFSEIEAFAQHIKIIGLEYNLQVLQTFSDVLVMHVKNFDIDNMNNVLISYPIIISELKNS